jgi:pentatricopeptide repeat protein
LMALLKDGLLIDALNTLERMKLENLFPTASVWVELVIHCMEDPSRHKYAQMVFKDLEIHTLPLELYTRLMKATLKNGFTGEALSIQQRLPLQGVKPDLKFYSAAIQGYIALKNEEMVIKLLDEMKSGGLTPDNGLVQICVSNTKIVDRLLDEMRKAGTLDLQTYNHLISGLFEAKLYDKAVNTLEAMKQDNLTPELSTYNCFVKGFVEANNLTKGVEFLNIIKKVGLKPESSTYHFLISGHVKNQRPRLALQFFDLMKQDGVTPDLSTFNTTIFELTNTQAISTAVELTDKMIQSGVNPSIFTLSTLFQALIEEDRVLEADVLFWKLKKQKVPMDKIVYNCLLQGYRTFGMTERKKQLLKVVNSVQKPNAKDN